MPMLSRSGNTTEVLQRMPDIRIGINQRWLPLTGSRYKITHISGAIFDFSLFRTSSILQSSLMVLPNVENMGIAVGISLLLCIEAETTFCLPYNRRPSSSVLLAPSPSQVSLAPSQPSVFFRGQFSGSSTFRSDTYIA